MASTMYGSFTGANVETGTGATAGAQHKAVITTKLSKIFHVSITYSVDPGADLRTRVEVSGGTSTVTDVVDKAFTYMAVGLP